MHTTAVVSASSTKDEVWLKSPRDLAQHLDTHIIGQERAKKVLAVAVFNHYHRVTNLLNATTVDQVDAQHPAPSDQGSYLDPSLSDTEISFSGGTTTATATITPKTRRRKISGTTEASNTSSYNQDLFNGKYSDDDKFGIKRDMDPTLVHSPSEWSAFPPPSPRYSSKPGAAEQPSTLLGRLARASVSAAARSSTGGDPTINEPDPGPFADIRATNTAPSRRMSQTTNSASQVDRSAAANDGTPPRGVESEMAEEEEGGVDDVASEMDEIVIEKSNVLMIGPTGSGKTLLAKTLARILDVPFASSDATSFTQAGYVGDDVENCVLRLLRAADYDVTRTEIGIIHIDECDKLARRGGGDGGWGGRDVGGEGVQQALLKLLEGTTVTLQAKPGTSTGHAAPGAGKSGDVYHRDPPMQRGFGAGLGSNHEFGKKGVREGLPLHGGGGGGASNSKGETFTVDTSNILFILSGSFVGLEKIISARIGKGSIGFGAILPEPKRGSETEDEVAEVFEKGEMIVTKKDRLKGLSTADLVEYGFIPEFVGRLPILAPLHPLSLSDLVRILVEPKNALTKQYKKLFARYGCDLRFSEKALYAVAEEASKRGGSARHLRSTLEELLLDAMYEVPGSAIRYAAVTEDVVRKAIPTLYFSRGQREMFYAALESDTDMGQPTPVEEDESEEPMRATA
ncbi:hypothetical protein QFC22_001250 [Naganishia vaughanmartiniae]|uniref:Uncharacterized protein n=1 Tax=Naganishia vaughanmartiniae TaxID=1424756 RepID=A0ACC2XI62_9TREE|nr:hypothetical protein QFC22_001250 [Naganishia vaughanmartiniae]